MQPRNLCFWIYLVASGAAVVTGMHFFGASISTFGTAWGVGSVMFGIYLVPWWLFLRHLDRYTPLPAKLRVAGFVWGAGAATFLLAVTANNALLGIWAKTQGLGWARDWSAGLTAPFNEELAKGAGLVLLIGLAPKLLRSAYDGFILGAFIGLGFEIVEDVTYAGQGAITAFGDHQSLGALGIFVARGAVGIVSHALFSAIFCAGVMFLLGRDGDRRVLLGVACLLGAMASHGSWDAMAALGGGGAGFFVVALVSVTLSITAVVLVARTAARNERTWMADVLAPEVAAGTVTQEEADALSGRPKARRRYVRHGGTGRGHRRRNRHVLAAARELADEIAHAGGADDERVRFARRELERLRRAARAVA